ncbi:MAG: polysaccharide biosynthesis C-terminal domain-containing protein [Planctomycetes bacterium]|nr:polysaccharide biosynthesis C-terminal domain-containing protein [Planctomycetota bacterium]
MNFRRWVVFTFLVHVLVVVVDKGGGLILYLLCANLPQEHGKAGIAASLPFILGAVANLGLATSLVYFVRRGRYPAQTAFETSMGMALGWGGFVAVAAAFVTLVVLPWFGGDAWRFDAIAVVPVCLAVPLLLVASYANSTQLATDRIRDYGAVHVVTSLAFLPAFFAFFFGFGGEVHRGDVPVAVAWGRVASTLVVAVLALWLVRSVVRLRVRVDRPYLRDALRYGWKANLTSTLTYLNHRLDLPVLAAVYLATLLGRGFGKDEAESLANAQVAFYSMSVTWAELVWHFPEAMRDLFFSKVAGSTHEQARMLTPILARLGLALSLVGALGIVLAIDPLMSLITTLAWGDASRWQAWSPTVGASLWVLVPGTVAFTVSKVLQADLAARDRLQTCVHAQLLVLVTMLGLDVLLIPDHGAIGAAAASSVAYVASTIYTSVAYARQTGTPIWRFLFVQPGDFRYIRDIVVAVIHKVRGRGKR